MKRSQIDKYSWLKQMDILTAKKFDVLLLKSDYMLNGIIPRRRKLC
jgi:hypothetical protein